MVNAAILVEDRVRRGAEPHPPILFRQVFSSDRLRESGGDVAEAGDADVANLADVSGADHLDALFVLLARTLLRADLHDAAVMPGGLDHPAAFADEERHRLFDVNVLAGGAGHDGQQRMPVVGSRNDHGVNILAVVHPAKILEAFGLLAGFLLDSRNAFAEPRLVHFTDRRRLHVGLGEKVEQMSFADQPYADESDANTLVRTKDVPVSRRAENPRAGGLQKAAPVFHVISSSSAETTDQHRCGGCQQVFHVDPPHPSKSVVYSGMFCFTYPQYCETARIVADDPKPDKKLIIGRTNIQMD